MGLIVEEFSRLFGMFCVGWGLGVGLGLLLLVVVCFLLAGGSKLRGDLFFLIL